ncbi:TTN1-like protein [Mya arenaria]|uniref:TTN1-like protein n=1 Tax=Mya arenaria TaxID=6604 RepID=A0ABY7EEL4_MYAAR|nr:TTN1-like protein [Mya arenaria]
MPVDGEKVTLAEEMDMQDFRIFDDGKSIVVESKQCGVSAGLCGQCVGNRDSLKDYSGTDQYGEPDYEDIVGNSFAVDNGYYPDEEKYMYLFHMYLNNCLPSPSSCGDYKAPDLTCELPVLQTAEALCGRACVFDFCQLSPTERADENLECSVAADLAKICNLHYKPLEWRSETFCPPSEVCPKGMNLSYTSNLDHSLPTCQDRRVKGKRHHEPEEGCECSSPGLYFDGDRCVPEEECGCKADMPGPNGQIIKAYMKLGDTIVLPGCKKQLTCKMKGKLNRARAVKEKVPKSRSCDKKTEVCALTEGVHQCIRKQFIILEAKENAPAAGSPAPRVGGGKRNKGGKIDQPKGDKSKGDKEDKPKGDKDDKPKGDKDVNPKGDKDNKPKGDNADQPKSDKDGKSKGDKEDQPKGDKEGKSKGDKDDKPKGDKEGKSKGDKDDKPKGDKEGKSKGENDDKPKGDKEGKSKGENDDKPKGDKEGQSKGDKDDKPKGDKDDKPKSDKGDKPKGDKDDKPKGDKDDKPKGDKEGKSKGDKDNKPKGDKEGKSKGDKGDKPKGDKEGKSKGDKDDKPKGDKDDKPKGDKDDKPKGDKGDKPKGDEDDKPKGDKEGKSKDDKEGQSKGDKDDKPKGDKGDKPKGDKDDKPKSDKGDKPKGDKDDKPKGDKDDKPKGDKGDKPKSGENKEDNPKGNKNDKPKGDKEDNPKSGKNKENKPKENVNEKPGGKQNPSEILPPKPKSSPKKQRPDSNQNPPPALPLPDRTNKQPLGAENLGGPVIDVAPTGQPGPSSGDEEPKQPLTGAEKPEVAVGEQAPEPCVVEETTPKPTLPPKPNKDKQLECLLQSDKKGLAYFGTQSKTTNGRTCQHWRDQEPHAHSYLKLKDDLNYCRNRPLSGVEGKDRPWCYTEDPNKEWEYCTISVCENEAQEKGEETPPPNPKPPADRGCYHLKDNGESYNGTLAVDENGAPCENWDKDSYQDVEGNFCRNPGGKRMKPWCFVEGIKHDCDIEACETPPPPKPEEKPKCSMVVQMTPCATTYTLRGSCEQNFEFPGQCKLSVAQKDAMTYRVFDGMEEKNSELTFESDKKNYFSRECGFVEIPEFDTVKITVPTCGMCAQAQANALKPGPSTTVEDVSKNGFCQA